MGSITAVLGLLFLMCSIEGREIAGGKHRGRNLGERGRVGVVSVAGRAKSPDLNNTINSTDSSSPGTTTPDSHTSTNSAVLVEEITSTPITDVSSTGTFQLQTAGDNTALLPLQGSCASPFPLCCPGRNDSCSREACLCDEACLTELFKDCCPDYATVCPAADLHTVTGKLNISIQAPAVTEDVAVIEALRNLSLVLQDYLTSKFPDVKSIRVTKITEE